MTSDPELNREAFLAEWAKWMPSSVLDVVKEAQGKPKRHKEIEGHDWEKGDGSLTVDSYEIYQASVHHSLTAGTLPREGLFVPKYTGEPFGSASYSQGRQLNEAYWQSLTREFIHPWWKRFFGRNQEKKDSEPLKHVGHGVQVVEVLSVNGDGTKAVVRVIKVDTPSVGTLKYLLQEKDSEEPHLLAHDLDSAKLDGIVSSAGTIVPAHIIEEIWVLENMPKAKKQK